MSDLGLIWNGVNNNLTPRRFTCAYCGSLVGSEKGWYATRWFNGVLSSEAWIYICPQCSAPTFFHRDEQIPGVVFGSYVSGIPDQSVAALYDEARKATGTGSYTATVLCCRKLLMHIAVSKGAKPGDSFISYVEYLVNNNYVPPDARDWVDHIRTKGNEANHEIKIMSKDDAQELLSFIEMLLKIIYEFPDKIKKKPQGSVPAP